MSRVALTPHPPSEGWNEARLWGIQTICAPAFAFEEIELAKLLRKRTVISLRPGRMTPVEILSSLSGLPQAELALVTFRYRPIKKGDLGAPRVVLTAPGLEVLARSAVVAAVVAAAVLTRRSMLGLTALSARYLMEGCAVVRKECGR